MYKDKLIVILVSYKFCDRSNDYCQQYFEVKLSMNNDIFWKSVQLTKVERLSKLCSAKISSDLTFGCKRYGQFHHRRCANLCCEHCFGMKLVWKMKVFGYVSN